MAPGKFQYQYTTPPTAYRTLNYGVMSKQISKFMNKFKLWRKQTYILL